MRRRRAKPRRVAHAATRTLAVALALGWAGAIEAQEVAESAFPGWDPAVEKRWDRRPASLGIENGYRDTLTAWAGGLAVAASRYSAFQIQVVEGIIGTEVNPTNLRYEETSRALQCLREIEGNTQRLLRLDDPEVLPVASAFQLEVFVDNILRPRRVWLAEYNWERLDELWRSFRGRDTAPPRGSDEMLALLLIETGARLEELRLIGQLARARESFERAIEHSPDSVAARYRAGFLAEKLGLYRRAHRQLDWLVERFPEDHEVRLRRALVSGRLGSGDVLADDLEELARIAGEEWIRAVAYQELARALAESDRPAAVQVLRRGLDALPDESALQTQLAFHLGPSSEEGRRLLEGVVERPATGEEPSSRGRYEEGRKEELREAQARFAAELEPRRGRLVEAMERIERFEQTRDAYRRHRGVDPDPVRRVFFECRGYRNP